MTKKEKKLVAYLLWEINHNLIPHEFYAGQFQEDSGSWILQVSAEEKKTLEKLVQKGEKL